MNDESTSRSCWCGECLTYRRGYEAALDRLIELVGVPDGCSADVRASIELEVLALDEAPGEITSHPITD